MDARPDDDAGADDTTGAQPAPGTPGAGRGEPLPPAADLGKGSAGAASSPPDASHGTDAASSPEASHGTDADTDDEVWASIVARLSDVDTEPGTAPGTGSDAAPGTGSGPPAEPRSGRVLRRAPREDEPSGVDDGPPPGGAAPQPVGRDWDGTSQYDAAEDSVDELEHFVPQDPGPVLGGDPLLTLAWGAAAGVPLFMLVVVVVWQDAPMLLVRAAAAVFVVAVGVLVWRMPQRREPSDDDGAVV